MSGPPTVVPAASVPAWDGEADVVVVGGGGCGLTAAVAASQQGASVLVLEKSRKPLSNTARSGGMIPAGGTRFQKAAGIEETPEDFARDILAKNAHTAEPARVQHLARTARELVEWLVDPVGVRLEFVDDFTYPGHSQFRMHAPPTRTGAQLVSDLEHAVSRAGDVEHLLDCGVHALVTDPDATDGTAVVGVLADHGGEPLALRAGAVLLACNGYGGNAEMLRRFCPEIADALYFGGEGSEGEAVLWGESLGADIAFMDAYQGHATVASPGDVLVTYAVVAEGGFHVNADGRRFGNEMAGYSEFAIDVLQQPGGEAVVVFDERIHELASQFPDYRDALELGVVKSAGTIDELAAVFSLPAATLQETLAEYQRVAAGEIADEFGRPAKRTAVLRPPFHGVRVTGALFHTQGGLVVDEVGRVLRRDGTPVPGLYAGGGAAAGISGHGAGGYLSGNGLLTALGYGMLAGRQAAADVARLSEVTS